MKIKGMFEDAPDSPSKAAPASQKNSPPSIPSILYGDDTPTVSVCPSAAGYGKNVFALKPRLSAAEAKARLLKLVQSNKNVRADYKAAISATPAESLVELCYFEVFNLEFEGYTVTKKVSHSVFKDSDEYHVQSKVVDGEIQSTVTRGKEYAYSYTTNETERHPQKTSRHASFLSAQFFSIFEAESNQLLSTDEFLNARLLRFDEHAASTPEISHLSTCIKKNFHSGEPYGIKLKQTIWFPVWRVSVTIGERTLISYISDEPQEKNALSGFSGINAPVTPRNDLQMLLAGLKRLTRVVKAFTGVCAVFMLMWMGEFQRPVPALLIATIALNVLFAILFRTDTNGDSEYIRALKAGRKTAHSAIKILANALLSIGTIALFTVFFVMSL